MKIIRRRFYPVFLPVMRCRKKEKSFSSRHLKNPAKSVILVRLHRKRRHASGRLSVRYPRILIRRCIEVVVTRTTRNRFVQRWARGFESHHLRQKKDRSKLSESYNLERSFFLFPDYRILFLSIISYVVKRICPKFRYFPLFYLYNFGVFYIDSNPPPMIILSQSLMFIFANFIERQEVFL